MTPYSIKRNWDWKRKCVDPYGFDIKPTEPMSSSKIRTSMVQGIWQYASFKTQRFEPCCGGKGASKMAHWLPQPWDVCTEWKRGVHTLNLKLFHSSEHTKKDVVSSEVRSNQATTSAQQKYKEDLGTNNLHRPTCTTGPLVRQERTFNKTPTIQAQETANWSRRKKIKLSFRVTGLLQNSGNIFPL